MHPANAMRSLPITSIDSSRFLDTSRCGMFLKSFPRHPMRRHLPNHPLKQCGYSPRPLFEATLSCVIFSANQPTPEQLSQLRSLVAQMSGGATVELGESGYIGTCPVLTGTMKHQSHPLRTCLLSIIWIRFSLLTQSSSRAYFRTYRLTYLQTPPRRYFRE